MKKLIAYAMVLFLAFASSCSSSSNPADNTSALYSEEPSASYAGSALTEAPDAVNTFDEIYFLDDDLKGVPMQYAVGTETLLYANMLNGTAPFSSGWLAAFGDVTQESFDTYKGYFDIMLYDDKIEASEGITYSFGWGNVQLSYSVDEKQIDVTWLIK